MKSDIQQIIICKPLKIVFSNDYCHQIYIMVCTNYPLSLIAACAAANLAIGTRKGEHDT